VPRMALKIRMPIHVIFDNIRSRYNVGAMFRTSDAGLVSRVFLAGITPRPPHPHIEKSALGALDVVPWEYCPDTRQVIKKMKQSGVFVVALELAHGASVLGETKLVFPVCFVVGNEVDGISQEVLDLCDAAISIPMLGRAHSLNVATAYGIALYEALRQYRQYPYVHTRNSQ